MMENDNNEKTQFQLNQIYFYLTDGCNLRCLHCWIEPKYKSNDSTYPSLGLEIFKSIIFQAKPLGLSSVKLTGGEPLLHPNIHEILEIILEEKLILNIETNGILCTRDIACMIASCKTPFVAVSLDGSDPATHDWIRGVEGSFDNALAGIKNLVKSGIHPQVIMTIMRRNKDQIEKVALLAESLGAGSVKFNIVQPTARGETLHRSGKTLGIEELIDLGNWVENELSGSTNIPLYYSHPAAFRPLGKMFGENGDGCQVCGILGIIGVLASGAYALCGIGQTVPELIFGDAENDQLKDIWKNSHVLNNIREGLKKRFEGICGDCLMMGNCLGCCLAQNYYSTKNFWSPYWYCDEAYKKGLFPETRIRP
jgi:SynChlorMet cassette radical SAM/SPASM protein ScmF